MRIYNSSAQTIREDRAGILEFDLVWITARNRSTQEDESIGFWTGEDDETITVTDLFTGISSARDFYARGILDIERPSYQVGFGIRPMTIRLSAISVAVQNAFRAYEPRGAKVQVWSRSYNPSTFANVAIEPVAKGFINKAPIETPEPGGEFSIEAEVVSTKRVLTFASGRKKSHEAQLKRSGDTFREYTATTGQWTVQWGPDPE